MDLDALRLATVEFVRAHQAWAPVIVGVLAFCESLAVLSLIVPATVLLLGIGALAGAIGIPVPPLVAGAALGAILGDWLSYEVARHFGEPIKRMWPLRNYPEMLARGEAFTRRFGAWAIFLGRFFGPARAAVPLVAGIFAMPRLPFQAANVLSALIWAVAMLLPGAGLTEWFRG